MPVPAHFRNCPCLVHEVCTSCFQKYSGYLCSLTGLFYCDFKARGMEGTCFECSFSSVKWLFLPKLFWLGQNIEGLTPVVLRGTSGVCAHSWSCMRVEDLPSQQTDACEKGEDIHLRTYPGSLKASWWIMLLFLPLFLSNTVRSHITFAQCVCFCEQHLL